MYQRVGKSAFTKDLTNTYKLVAALGNPHKLFKSVHIAGTNGKGSSSHILSSILQQAGYKTGLYTSPHLKNFTERIRVDGQEIPQSEVVAFVNSCHDSILEIEPSFFEMTVAMAFAYFAKVEVDIAVIEVGLGGRLDSTNVIQPEVSLITNIGYDHQDILGETLPEIAAEKAGIIKENTPAVISEYQEEIWSVFYETAKKKEAPLINASTEYHISEEAQKLSIKTPTTTLDNINMDVQGKYQTKNLVGVLAVVDQLRELGYQITDQDIRLGLQHISSNTGLKGRWQILGEHPTIVCDTAHNEEGISLVLAQLASTEHEHCHIVWGMVKDKHIEKVLKLLPPKASYYFTQSKVPRALDAKTLQERAKSYDLIGNSYSEVNMAIEAAKRAAKPADVIFIGGSTFVVAEINEL